MLSADFIRGVAVGLRFAPAATRGHTSASLPRLTADLEQLARTTEASLARELVIRDEKAEHALDVMLAQISGWR